MNIREFKTQLADGGARPNQFKVTIPFPYGGAEGSKQLLISGAAMPASTVNPVITQYRGREVKFAGERIYDPWTITVINDSDMALRGSFEKWMNEINNHDDNGGDTAWSNYVCDITVEHLDRNDDTLSNGNIVLEEAFPINMSEIALQYAQNDIIEEFTVTFQYQSYRVANESVGGGGAGSAIGAF
tara:strand:- start:723 stop:1280 length:558 start_codon:yes stop_codon:yes gene_type:complete